MTGFVVWTIRKCVLTHSWNVTEIQLVHQQLAKCYYLKSGRKGAHSPKAAVFIFILSKSCDCKVTPNSTGYFLSSLNLHIMKSTIFKFHPLHNSSHFHLFPFFSTKWTWKQEVPLCFPDVSQQGKKRPPRWSVTGLLWWCQGHNLDFCHPWLCKFYLGCLFTHFSSLINTQYQHCPALVSEQFKH